MHRGSFWPMAKGSEENVLAAGGVWLAALILQKSSNGWMSKLFFGLASAALGTVLYFFRDPDRATSLPEDVVLSPADGEIVDIKRERESRYLNRDTVRISIFLSLLDVHVQRNPVSGRVTMIDHQPGQFVEAFRPEASDVNEYIAMVIDNERAGPVLVKQIAGIMARRCVNHETVGHYVRVGDRFGMIRFGSRVDLYLPADAAPLAAIGDQVFAGVTPLATI